MATQSDFFESERERESVCRGQFPGHSWSTPGHSRVLDVTYLARYCYKTRLRTTVIRSETNAQESVGEIAKPRAATPRRAPCACGPIAAATTPSCAVCCGLVAARDCASRARPEAGAQRGVQREAVTLTSVLYVQQRHVDVPQRLPLHLRLRVSAVPHERCGRVVPRRSIGGDVKLCVQN